MNRGKHDLYRDILTYCKNGESKSHIMSDCRLSWLQFTQIMPFLLRKRFIETHKEERPDENGHMRKMLMFQTTKEGTVLLMALENIDTMLSETPLFIIPKTH